MVTKAIDSKGVTRQLVTAHSGRLKVLRFDIDPRIAFVLGNITDLGHPEALRRFAVAKSGRPRLHEILPTSYRRSQEKFLKPVKKCLGRREFVADLCSNAFDDSHPVRERKG